MGPRPTYRRVSNPTLCRMTWLRWAAAGFAAHTSNGAQIATYMILRVMSRQSMGASLVFVQEVVLR